MFKLLVKLFVKNSENTNDTKVRNSYGKLCGITGIILNIFMSSLKIITGILTNTISVVSDGINNLSDAGSSIITLLGFKLSAKKPDKEHPFGHGRMEYFAGLLVSLIIIIVSVELSITSLQKIINNEVSENLNNNVLILTIIVLSLSIVIKLWMALYNNYAGKKINSIALKATSLDSITDCISTTVVLICTILSIYFKNVPIDGIAGLIVSLFILYTGLKSVKEVVDLLMGEAPDPKFIKEISDYVLSFNENVVGIHDLMLHDYGPGRKILVLHVEVPANGNILELHDLIDNIETSLYEKFNLITTIHMDPVVIDSERVEKLKELCKNIVRELNSEFNIHDFRMNEGETHANLIFDVVITHENKLSNREISNYINKRLKENDKKLNAVIKVEYPFV